MNGIIMRGEQIIVPQSLRTDVIRLAHKAYQGADKTLKLLRQTSWFPGTGKLVKDFVESCIGCLASNCYIRSVPLEPNLLPNKYWQKLHAEFKGPIGVNITYTSSLINTQNILKLILKLVSAIFYQIFIFPPNGSPSKTMKCVFYFI